MSGRHSNSNLLKNDSISLKEEIQNSKYEHVEFFTCSSCERIWQIGYPSILAFGLIGNALCFAAFAAHKLRHETRLLCSLCAAIDSLALIASFASRWPDAAFGISALNPVLCHVLVTANYWLPELAAWTLVYLTVERFISAVFAVAEMLAFGQHAIQFYVYFACSARFRKALLTNCKKQLNFFLYRLGRCILPQVEPAAPTPDPEASNANPSGRNRVHFNLRSPVQPGSSSRSSASCHHAFIWIDPHILLCRQCLHERVVHHPSCRHFREEHRFECECLLASIEHPAHLVVHLGDRQSPFFGL